MNARGGCDAPPARDHKHGFANCQPAVGYARTTASGWRPGNGSPAKTKLRRAGCRLGRVRAADSSQSTRHGLVAIAHQRAAATSHPAGTKVNVTTGMPRHKGRHH